jgi:hypothetical protein
MPESGTGRLEILLFSGLAILLAGFLFVSALEGWRRWSQYRRFKNHFRSSSEPRKIVVGYVRVLLADGDDVTLQLAQYWALVHGIAISVTLLIVILALLIKRYTL